MGRFSDSIKSVSKVYNHEAAMPAKVEIRRNVLAAIGKKASVFDGFAGPGEMYRAIWKEAGAYVGCDIDWHKDERACFVADNRRVMRCIDLSQFSIFDLDAYGSPWEQVIILAARRRVAKGEKIGLILTDGSGLFLKQGGVPNALVQITGLRKRLPGLGRWQADIINRAIAGITRKMGCKIVRRWEAKGRTGAGVWYIGLVLEGAG